MSYADCRSEFTPQQSGRMFGWTAYQLAGTHSGDVDYVYDTEVANDGIQLPSGGNTGSIPTTVYNPGDIHFSASNTLTSAHTFKAGKAIEITGDFYAMPSSGTITFKTGHLPGGGTSSPSTRITQNNSVPVLQQKVPEAFKKLGEKPDEVVLFPNHPNPVRSSTRIRYGLPAPSAVSLVVYNALGQKVTHLLQKTAGQGIIASDSTPPGCPRACTSIACRRAAWRRSAAWWCCDKREASKSL